MNETQILNDEPATDDKLGRKDYAKALSAIAHTCDTPIAIGLYGRWGVGKTSLMRLVEADLEADENFECVWFDAWRHQFDEHPAVGLMHALANKFQIQDSVKQILTSVARALGSWALNATTTIDVKDIESSLRSYEEANFRIQDERTRLYQSFQKVVRAAQKAKRNGDHSPRIIFFIDDLDRCLPAQILSVLESLKLFLNLDGCVYFLGVDRHALESSIRHHYKDLELDEVSYLDKIIQLPFTIPPIAPDSIKSFIESLLPAELAPCREILANGLSGNPRGIKRFVNTLILNHNLAAITVTKPRVEILAVLLLIQYRNPELYSAIARYPSLISDLCSDAPESLAIREKHPEADECVLEAIGTVDLSDQSTLESYIYLTSLVRVSQEPMQDERGFYTEAGLETLLAESGRLARGEFLRESFLLLESTRQHTWLAATNHHLWCLLDDSKTRSKGTVIQWCQPLNKSRKIRAFKSKQGKRVVELGAKNPWIYSRRLHPDPQELETEIIAMINRAKR